MKLKLTDEELSRILGKADAGELNWWGCCPAVCADALEYFGFNSDKRSWTISQASQSVRNDCKLPPDELLCELWRVGLA